MQIFVRSPNGRMISLMVYPHETLYHVKKKLIEKHDLVFNGVQMDNDYRTLADYNIKHQSTLDLQEKILIYIKETLHGLTYSVNVDTSDTIDNLKDKIEATEGFPKGRQCLIFVDQQLEGKRTLRDYKIYKDSTLLLVLLPCIEGTMQIFVRMVEPKTATFKVDSSDTVDSLKVKIYEMNGTRPVEQRLIFNGKQIEGNHTLASYNIKNECTIHLVLRLRGS